MQILNNFGAQPGKWFGGTLKMQISNYLIWATFKPCSENGPWRPETKPFWILFGPFFVVFLKKCCVLRYLLNATARFTRILRGLFVVLFVFFFGSTQENLVFYESCFSEDE